MFVIERLEARPNSAKRKRIAVLDDDRDLTDSICAHLQDSGYDAHPFYRTADLQTRSKNERYDAFVIDWIVGETSTVKLIAAIRAQDATCPIVVLTAQVLAGVVQESEIAQAVASFNFMFAEKPVRMTILSASLARAFAAR
jgi:DNA-binding NtrC family response regulator